MDVDIVFDEGLGEEESLIPYDFSFLGDDSDYGGGSIWVSEEVLLNLLGAVLYNDSEKLNGSEPDVEMGLSE